MKNNFLCLALYQIVVRIGWVFKTESIIMPAVLDSLAGPAWLRGMLPMLNRIGQSIPPMLFANRVQKTPTKKQPLAYFTFGMAAAFGLLSTLWICELHTRRFAPVLFLILYAFFFACTGMANVAFGTLQGKLLPENTRGRLLVVANSTGAACAIGFAAWLMHRWLSQGTGAFGYVFGFTAISFAIASFITAWIKEKPDADRKSSDPTNPPETYWQILKGDRAFRRALVIALLFGSSMTIFPHYQALARERLGLSFDSMTGWVIIQNLGTGLFGIVFGFLADMKGNRAVLRIAVFGVALIPLLALSLSRAGDVGRQYYWTVFVLFSLTPVTIKMLNNFALEFTPPNNHSRYLSLMGLSIAIPIYFAPLFGMLIDRFGFEAPMLFISGMVLAGWLCTLFVSEPRSTRLETDSQSDSSSDNEVAARTY